MKQSRALALAATLAASAALGSAATSSAARISAHSPRLGPSLLSVGGEGDDGGALPGGRVAHGSIGSAAPSAGAALSLRALGGDDGPGSDDGGSLPGGVAHGTIGGTPPNPHAASHLKALGGSDA